jgi:glycosyltransferase involved in cell wall biosynthesis
MKDLNSSPSVPAARVAIVQPYVPTYRVAFFEGVRTRMAMHGVEVTVLADTPSGVQNQRNDSADVPWLEHYRQRTLPLGHRSLRLGTAYGHWKSCDAVIVGHLGSSLDSNLALALSSSRRLKVGVWGHIGSYVGAANPIDALVERWQVRKVGQVFAYTPGGARIATALGADPANVTTVMNTIDTSSLESALATTSDAAVRDFVALHSFNPNKSFCFIGGLDSSKRIDFLVSALDRLWELDPEIRVLIAGKGADESLLTGAVNRGQVVLLGYADERLKALLAKTTRGILMPGRVGLIAVDALVMGLPVLSTDWPFHAPEAEYLQPGESMLQSSDSPDAFADLMWMESKRPTSRTIETRYPRLEDMINNYSTGILNLLNR